MARVSSVIFVILACSALLAGAQPLDGQIESIGFPAATPTGSVVRAGRWFPIRVQLAAQGTGTYSRELRFEAIDLDGDRVSFVQPQVTLSAEGGAKQRRVTCYAVVNSVADFPPALDVLDEQGVSRAKLAISPCDLLHPDDLLVLDISNEPVTALGRLTSSALGPGQSSAGIRDYYRGIVVSRQRAPDLPDRWFGLEAVDVIFWDRPNPSELTLGQFDALAEWIRAGGQLVIGIGPTWDALRDSALGPLLPLAGEGTRVDVQNLPVFVKNMASTAWGSQPLERAISVTSAPLAEGALRTLGESGPTGSINMIAMRLVGSGRVTTVAASLRDLLGATRVEDDKFFAALLELNRYTKDYKEKQGNIVNTALTETELYKPFTSPIAFGTATTLRQLLAFVFVGGYIVIATLASWWYLRLKGKTHHSWTVFAGFAIAASALSLFTVRATSGFAAGVQSLNIVDLEAGQSAGRGTCLFGYRSAVGVRADVTLPGEASYIRPLARGPGLPTSYVTPERFDTFPAKAKITDLPVRATLKQVEGYWHGEVDGTLRASLVVDRGTGRITPESWLSNDLPFDLAEGVLIYTDPRLDDGGVPRPANQRKLYRGLPARYDAAVRADVQARLKKPTKPAAVPPAENILALPLPRTRAGERISALGKSIYDRVDELWGDWARRKEPDRADMPDLPTLRSEQSGWRGSLLGIEVTQTVLLASTRDYYLPCSGRDFDTPITSVSLDGLPRLDISHWLVSGRDRDGGDAGYAILVAWTDPGVAGPAVLSIDGKPQPAYGGRAIFRVRIPIRYVGSPPSGEDGNP